MTLEEKQKLTLKDTVPGMLSDDYRERLKAEYLQCVYRVRQLEMCGEELTLLMNHQLIIMKQYKRILERRMKDMGIKI